MGGANEGAKDPHLPAFKLFNSILYMFFGSGEPKVSAVIIEH